MDGREGAAGLGAVIGTKFGTASVLSLSKKRFNVFRYFALVRCTYKTAYAPASKAGCCGFVSCLCDFFFDVSVVTSTFCVNNKFVRYKVRTSFGGLVIEHSSVGMHGRRICMSLIMCFA